MITSTDNKPHRASLVVEQARILMHEARGCEQFLLRLEAAQCAAKALPGQFVHLQCDASLPLRRPLSIMRADSQHGWIELLYKVVGQGTQLLAKRQLGEYLDLIGPIGQPFTCDPKYPRPLLLGGGVGIPPMIFAALAMREDKRYQPLVLMGSEIRFPFTQVPSKILVPGIPNEVTATIPLLDDYGIAARLTSKADFPGCFDGFVTDLARIWLDQLSVTERSQVMLMACGPHPMLAACAKLAKDYDLPCQVSLEEFMACGIGGCAGCAVKVRQGTQTTMQRVCVDGPVFDAQTVF